MLAAGWLVLVIYAFPGQLTQDGYDHLREVRDRLWTDANPALMNLVWRIVDYVVAGTFGMLALQATLVVFGLYLVLRRALAPRAAAWCATALLLFPPVFVPLPVIGKDPLMTGLLLLGAVGVWSARRGPRIAGLCLLGLATAVRFNAFAATFPLIVLGTAWWPTAPRWRRYPATIAAWIAITLGAFAANAAMTDREMHPWHSTLALFDIVGTLANIDGELPDAELDRLLAGTELRVHRDIHAAIRRAYLPSDYLPIVLARDGSALWQVPINGYVAAPEAQRTAIARAFRDVIVAYPGAYVRHRVAVLGEVLTLGHGAPEAAVRSRSIAYPDYHKSLGLGTGHSALQNKLTRWLVAACKHTPLLSPWLWAVVALVLLPLVVRQRDALSLLSSGLAFELSLLPLAPSSDFRYSHWMILTTCVVAILLTVRRARAARARPSAPAPEQPSTPSDLLE